MSETFLFVHGAWHGGWCWKDTEKALRELGHETHAPTLSGLGELSHLAHPDITPDSHVEDIWQHGSARWGIAPVSEHCEAEQCHCG